MRVLTILRVFELLIAPRAVRSQRHKVPDVLVQKVKPIVELVPIKQKRLLIIELLNFMLQQQSGVLICDADDSGPTFSFSIIISNLRDLCARYSRGLIELSVERTSLCLRNG